MCPSNLNREDPEAIRMVLQRLCHGGEPVTLAFGHLRGEFRILAETPDRVILALSDVERGQWGLKPGAKLTLSLTDRGLPFEAVVEFQGHGRFHGVEASHVSLPRLLRATEAHRLADYIPDRPVPCSYADHHSNVRDGLLQAFGMDGVELAAPEGLPSLSEVLRLHTASTVEFHAPGDTHFVLPVSVAYLGDRYWGLRFPEAMDPHLLGRYRQWLQEARRAQAQLDLKGFDPGGAEARETASRDLAGPSPHLHADRDPLILVLAEGEAFPLRLAAALGRKFGVAALDLARGNVRAPGGPGRRTGGGVGKGPPDPGPPLRARRVGPGGLPPAGPGGTVPAAHPDRRNGGGGRPQAEPLHLRWRRGLPRGGALQGVECAPAPG
jgi:hypothetical protein